MVHPVQKEDLDRGWHMGSKWLQAARDKMEKKGTVGKFTRDSKRAGQSTGAHASSVLHSNSASGTEKKEANFARMAKRGWKPLK